MNVYESIQPRKKKIIIKINSVLLKKALTPTTLRCVIISFTSRSSGNTEGEPGDRCCCADFAILPNLIKTCTRRLADNGSAAKK